MKTFTVTAGVILCGLALIAAVAAGGTFLLEILDFSPDMIGRELFPSAMLGAFLAALFNRAFLRDRMPGRTLTALNVLYLLLPAVAAVFLTAFYCGMSYGACGSSPWDYLAPFPIAEVFIAVDIWLARRRGR